MKKKLLSLGEDSCKELESLSKQRGWTQSETVRRMVRDAYAMLQPPLVTEIQLLEGKDGIKIGGDGSWHTVVRLSTGTVFGDFQTVPKTALRVDFYKTVGFEYGFEFNHGIVLDRHGHIRAGSGSESSYAHAGDMIMLSGIAPRLDGVSPEIRGYHLYISTRVQVGGWDNGIRLHDYTYVCIPITD